MNDMWTGGKVRLRGVEPEDWKGFRDRPGTLPTHAQPTRSSPRVPTRASGPGPLNAPGGLPAAKRFDWWSRCSPTLSSPGP